MNNISYQRSIGCHTQSANNFECEQNEMHQQVQSRLLLFRKQNSY